MLKHEIRKIFLQKRKSISVAELNKLNLKIKKLFIGILAEDIKTVHIYLPIKLKAENDTWPIIRELWAKNIRVVVPVMNPQNNTMNSTLLTKDPQLVENKWKVPEPLRSVEIDEKEIDAVVIPLLAFDKKGFRVGYGKGYYDRFLTSLSQNPTKIGLSFFPPVSNIIDKDPWDIPLDYCISPEQVFTF